LNPGSCVVCRIHVRSPLRGRPNYEPSRLDKANRCSVTYEHMFPRLAVLLLVVAFVVGVIARPSGGAGKPVAYMVKPTDTLWSIATVHYAGDPRQGIWELQRRNHLHGTTLVPGQRLVLP
jgi:LysM domain-containing protein